MININGKEYRNIQEQVEKNQEDIETLQEDKQDTLTAGNGIYITDNVVSINSTKVLTVDDENNLSKSMIRVPEISSLAGEDSDNKGRIYLNSGISTGSVLLEAGGEESDASLRVRGTSAVGSEGLIEINGKTSIYTDNRIIVIDSNNDTEQVAYLSDINTVLGDIETLLAAI